VVLRTRANKLSDAATAFTKELGRLKNKAEQLGDVPSPGMGGPLDWDSDSEEILEEFIEDDYDGEENDTI
jgi:hypothetical protein